MKVERKKEIAGWVIGIAAASALMGWFGFWVFTVIFAVSQWPIKRKV